MILSRVIKITKHSQNIVVIGIVFILVSLSFPLHSAGYTIKHHDDYQRIHEDHINIGIANQSVYSDDLSEYWAIIVAPPDNEHDPSEEAYYHFATQAENYKELLCNYGWKENHIKMLTLQNATYTNLLDAYEWFAVHDKPSDTDLIVMISHGGSWRFMLTGTHSSYTYEEMGGHLELLDAQNIIISISACYSGSAIPYLEREGRVITTASRNNEPATTRFLNSFMNALDGIGDTEGNNNRVISVEEAFSCVQNDSIEGEWGFYPQINDQIQGSSHLIFLHKKDGVIDQITSAPRHVSGISIIGPEDRKAAQSFIPTSNVLTKIQLPIRSMIEPNQPLLVSIKKNLSDQDLVSCSIKPEDVGDLWGRFYAIDIPDLSVTPGETYYIVCETMECGRWRWPATNYPEKDVYPSGCMYENIQDQGWITHDCCDLIFCTYTDIQGNSAPQVPKRPCGPTEGFQDISYDFSFSTVDDEDDMISYCIDWGDGSQTWTEPYPSDTIETLSHVWNESGCYPIRVKAKDSNGQETDWSDYFYVTIDMNHAPTPPTISGPKAVKRLEENEFCIHADDSDGDSLYYFVYWGYGSTSGWLGPYNSDADVLISNSWSHCSSYPIWVKTRDEKGRESTWSTSSVHVFPEIIIEKPHHGFYIMNAKIEVSNIDPPVVIGNIDVVLDETYAESFSSAEFYIDDTKMYTDNSEPYLWNWNKICFGRYVLKVVLFSDSGEHVEYNNVIWKFL